MRMNIIDQVVSWFSPQRGFARQAWRDALRHYDAGDDSRLNANWRAINTSAEQTAIAGTPSGPVPATWNATQICSMG